MHCSWCSGKCVSILRGNGVQELKGAGGMSRMVDFIARSWGGLGRSWHSFSLIFSRSFLTLIFHRFFLDFGGVLGWFWEAKMVQKSRFWRFFWMCLWRPYFWSIFSRFLIKSMAKNVLFFCYFVCYFVCFSQRSKP